MPTYAHLSLVLGEDRSKLSKRHGATSVNQFKEEGFLPEAMINYLCNLGWNDGTDQEIYTVDELVAVPCPLPPPARTRRALGRAPRSPERVPAGLGGRPARRATSPADRPCPRDEPCFVMGPP